MKISTKIDRKRKVLWFIHRKVFLLFDGATIEFEEHSCVRDGQLLLISLASEIGMLSLVITFD